MAITREDIVWGYRLLLDREPESPEAVDRFTAALRSRRELRQALLQSEEFRARNPLDSAFTSESCVVIAEIEPGLRLFVDLSDVAIGLNVARKSYEPGEVAFLRRTLKPGQVVLDLGANIGFYTVLSASLVGPGGHVYAFEPIAANADLLERSVRENGFEGRVTLNRAAVGDGSGTRQLVHLPLGRNARNSGGSYLSPPGAPAPRGHDLLAVPMLRLDEADLRRPVHFVKADVEGAEPLAFRGARDLISRDRPVILAEINPIQLPRVSGCSPRQFLEEVRSLGYLGFALRDGRLRPLGNGDSGEEICNVAFLPEGIPFPEND